MNGKANAGSRQSSGAYVPGQASVELIALLGMLLLVILAFAVFSSDLLGSFTGQQALKQAQESVQVLAGAADSVYAQGEGATETVSITIPEGADLDRAKSYIGRPYGASTAIRPNAISLNIDGSDVSAYSRAPLTGSFPNATGTQAMKVVSHGSYVSVGGNVLDASPSSLYLKMRREDKNYASLLFITNAQSVRAVLEPEWQYGSPRLSITPSSFSVVGSGTPVQVDVAAYSGPLDAGIYTGKITVLAYSSSYAGMAPTTGTLRESFEIPFTIEVEA